MANARLYPSWGSLTEALKTGQKPQATSRRRARFRRALCRSGGLRVFLGAMSGVSLRRGAGAGREFPWPVIGRFADIGSAQGMVPATIAGTHQHLSGAGFDLPEVKPIFEKFLPARGGGAGKIS